MKKLISLIVTICFVISSFNNVLFASINNTINNGSTENMLPKNLGITVSNLNDSKNIVINIQDLHANPQVQKNINAILKYLSDNNNIKSIYLEGANGKVNISWLKNLDTKDKTEISNILLNIGMLTGTEFFSINDTHNIPLYGLEDKTIHEENIDNLSVLINNNNFIEEKLLSIKKDLTILNNRFVNKENKQFSKLINKYNSKEINTLDFYSKLITYVEKISNNSKEYNNLINLTKEDYPNILLLKDLLLTEKQTDKNSLYKEIKLVLTEIKQNLSSAQYKDFLSVTDNASNIKELSYFINRFATNNNLDLAKNYPNINLMIKCNTISENINFTEILKEEKLVINNIKAALSYDSNEYEIVFLNDFYTYLEKALTNKLQSKDYNYFISSIGKFESLYPKYVVYNQISDIKKYIEISKEFYNINNKRNDIFVNKIKKDITANSKDKNIIILVTGGYHSEGLKEILSKQDVSFITITPQITNLTNTPNIYNNIISEESREYSNNTISFTIASQMQDDTFIKTLINAGLQNKVPFQKIKQIAENIFKDKFTDNDNSFTLNTGVEPVTIIQQNGYAVLSSNIKTDEKLTDDLSVLAQDITTKDNKSGIKFLLNLLNVVNHYQSFDNFSLTEQNDILKSLIKSLVFMAENLNIQFSNGFEQENIEEYVNTKIINNSSRQDKTLNGIDINTARYLPKIIQSILYENDKSEKEIEKRINQALQRTNVDTETNYLNQYYNGIFQISGLLSSIIKEVLTFVESDKKLSPELKPFFNNFVDISDIASYITIAVFGLDDNSKGISLEQGLIGLTAKLNFPTIIEGMGHEFAHETLLYLKDYITPDNTTARNKLLAHETHSYLFSILFAQIFNDIVSSSFSDTGNYDKFLLDLNNLYSDTIRKDLTDKTKSMAETSEVHVAALNFINMLNRCLGKDNNIMDLQQLIYLAQTVREVFLSKDFEESSYSAIFYTILLEFAKKINPSSKFVIDSYYNQIINSTKFFTMDEQNNDSLLIENFATVLLTGNSIQTETFIKEDLLSPQKNTEEYRNILRKFYKQRLKADPSLYEITDEICFTILGNKVLALKGNGSEDVLKQLKEILRQLTEFLGTCKDIGVTDYKNALIKLLNLLKEQEGIENFTSDNIENLFLNSLTLVYADKSLFSIKQDDSYIYKAINEVLPEILKKHNKVLNFEEVINLILNPSVYQSIDITKEILKTNDNLEESLEILTELFVTLVKEYNISFNTNIVNSKIKDYVKGKESTAGVPADTFSKLPAFIQEILYNAETTKITKNLNEFTRDYYKEDKAKTNALLKLVLQETYTLLKNQGYKELLSIPNTEDITIFEGRIPSGVSEDNFIAVNPNNEEFLNVIAHELGHILFTNSGFSHYKSDIVHELFAYTLGLLTTTIYNDNDIKTQQLLPVTYENIIDRDEHSLAKTLLQLVIDVNGIALTETQLLSVLNACKRVLMLNTSKMDNIKLAYSILDALEQDSKFMQNFMPNAFTTKLETVLDEPLERKEKILQLLFNNTVSTGILITDKETFLRNKEEQVIFIDKKILNEIFDTEGNIIIEGKEQEFRYLTELLRLQILQQYDLTKEERLNDFESLYSYFIKDLEIMLKQPQFKNYHITFKKEANRTKEDEQEFVYVNPQVLKNTGRSKYLEYLIALILLRFFENKFNKEFETDAKFDFCVTTDNLDDIPVDLKEFSKPSRNNYEYLKQEYNKHNSRQKKIKKAINIILKKNKVADKELFANKIKNLMYIVENPNIDFVSIEFFRELASGVNNSTMQQIYNNLLETYSYLIENNILDFNSRTDEDLKDYVMVYHPQALEDIETDTLLQMPTFIQKILFKNFSIEEKVRTSPDFIKIAKFKSNKLNGLLNVISQDVTSIIKKIYPNTDENILSAQLFFSSMERLTDGANYGNNRIAISNQLINRYKDDPEVLINEILKAISHELGHEELILKGVSGSTNMIDTLHELYAYLFELLFIKSYSKTKGIRETESVFATSEKSSPVRKVLDGIYIAKTMLKDFISGTTDEHTQALDILALLQQPRYKSFFPKEKVIETLGIIETFAKGLIFEDDNITKIISVDDLNMQALSFFTLIFIFGDDLDIYMPKLLDLSKALTVFNTEIFNPEEVLEAFIRKDVDFMYMLIDEIISEGNKRINEINQMLFDNKTFEFNNKTYGYSITTNRSENGLLKDDKILIYFTPSEIKFMAKALTDNKKIKSIKRKADILTNNIAENPYAFILLQQVNVVANQDTSIKTIKKVLQAPIQRVLSIAIFKLDTAKILKNLLTTSPFTNSQSINVVYYDNLSLINSRKDILSVYVTEKEPYEKAFELTEYTINGRSLRISYDKENNFITAYCPQASKQEIIEMTAKHIKTILTSRNTNTNINIKNIVVDSDVATDTMTYTLSQDNEGFEYISSSFMELGIVFIEELLKLDDIESVMFSKQIYDYIGNIPFEQLSKILKDTSLGDNQIIIDSDTLLDKDILSNRKLLKALLQTTQLKVITKVSSKQEMEELYNIYEITDFMLESEKDNATSRAIVEYNPYEGFTQKAPVSYIELTDLTNIEDKLKNIPSHQAIVISVNSESAKNINLNDNMILSSLKTTITRILKTKSISKKTASNMGKILAKQVKITDEEKEKLANSYNAIKKSLTSENLAKLITDYPNVFITDAQAYIEKLFDNEDVEMTPAHVAFIDAFLNNILYDDNIEDLKVEISQTDDIKYYKNILSAA
ncbi:MAG: hypothetical protein K5622_01450 [Endomicrobiaceae bacterium]|nr:hypothetical protein [Endomicrobiaceae bacterium]